MISTYFGSITIVLKLPFTSAASTNGLHRYRAFGSRGSTGDDGIEAGFWTSFGGNVADVGVGERLGGLWDRVIERLEVFRQTLTAQPRIHVRT